MNLKLPIDVSVCKIVAHLSVVSLLQIPSGVLDGWPSS